MRWARPALVCVLALAVPAALRMWVQAGVRDVEAAVAAAIRPSVDVELGGIEADLTGTLRFSDVRIGDWLRARSVEGSVGASSILAGRLRADEVRVAHPQVKIELGKLPVLVRRGSASGGGGPARAKRIVVTEGALEIAIGDVATVRASGVELHPTAAGVRVVTGDVQVSAHSGEVTGALRFERAGVDVDLPGGRLRRAVASGGTLEVRAGDARYALTEVVAQHGVPAGETRLDARAADGERVSAVVTRGAGLALEGTFDPVPLALVPASLRPRWLLGTGRLGGSFQARRSDEGWDLVGDLRAEGIGLSHELLAAQPVMLGRAAVQGRASVGGGQAWFAGTVAHERITLEIDGTLGPEGVAGSLRMPASGCGDVLAAIPETVRAPLAGLGLDGTIGVEVKATAPHAGEARLDVALDLRCRAVAEASGKDPRAIARHQFPDGQERRFAESDPDFAALGGLPRHVVAAFVSAEDGRFFSHRGIDPIELGRSFAADVAARKPVRGGSTLTQQVAKNLWLGRDRTLGRKLVEAVLAWRLEATLDKRRILEIYLGVIELGEGVWGLTAGARRWFDVPPSRLTVPQAAFLAAITPEPRSAERRIREAGGLDERTRERTRIVLGAMKKDKAIDRETYERALHQLRTLRLEATDLRKASLP